MKPGSSRGIDTRRQHKSEQSKRRRNLRLTNRSTKPYPWPPKQAQPDVSKPDRSTSRPTAYKYASVITRQLQAPLGLDACEDRLSQLTFTSPQRE